MLRPWPHLSQRTARQEQDLGGAVGSWAPRHLGSLRVTARVGTGFPPAPFSHILSIPLQPPHFQRGNACAMALQEGAGLTVGARGL